MISIRYPSSPDAVDLSGFTDGLAGIGRRLGERRDEKEAAELFMKGLMGGQQLQQQPMSLAALAPQADPEQIQRSTLPSLAKPSLRVQQAHSGEGSPFAGAEAKQDRLPQTGDVFGRFIRTVRAGGVTNPNALAAIASTGKRESGFQPENAFGSWSDPSQSGQPGEAGGIMSWRGPRLQSLRQFAQQIGDDPSAPSPEAQAQFLLQEDPSLIEKLQAAQSPEDAQSLMNAAWRYAGHDQPGGETAARMETARSFAGQFGGQQQAPAQGQLESMAVGGSTPMPQGQPQAAPQGGPSMPDAATMKAMFANPITRPLTIDLARSRLAAMQDQNDPMKRVAYEKALLEVEALRRGDTKPTDDMREFEFARQQGFGGSFVDFQLAQKKAGATSITTSVGEGDKFYENLDKKNAETFSALSDAGQQGRSKMGQIDALENLLNSAPSGATAMFKQFAGEYGINTEGLDDIQAAEALINQMVPTQRLPGSGTMSDADLALFKRSLPRLINQPGGNETIIETIRGITEYEIQAGEIADAVADRAISPVEGRKALRALQNPLARFKRTPDGANGPRQGSGAVPGAGSSTGRQRARNPQTGAEMEWDGRQWSPVR